MQKLFACALLCAALTGCAGMNTDFDCNKTATDQCLSMSEASHLAAQHKSLDDLSGESAAGPKPAAEPLAVPWRMYDGQSDLYINGRSVGFMLELSPLIGANQQVVQGLDALLREKLPRKTPLTVMMVASKCVGGMLQQALSTDMWKGPMAPRLNAITRAYWERAALKGFTNKREYPLYLRNYRVFLVYAQSGRGGISGMDEVSRVRDSVTMALKGAYMDCRRVQPGEFLSVMREQLNYRPGQVTAISVLASRLAQPDTVVFDMRGTVNAFKQQSAQVTLTPERAASLTTRFNNALQSSLADWQQAHNAVILEKGAVVSEVQDITPVIQADIARQMQEATSAGGAGAPDLSGAKP